MKLLLAIAVALMPAPPAPKTVAPKPAVAQDAPPAECGPDRQNCLGWARGNLDLDDKPDTAVILYDPRQKMYSVHVETSTGLHYIPFQAAHDPKDRVTLTYRTGPGDVRCRNYIADKGCGYPIVSHAPVCGFFLSDSRHGDFLLMFDLPLAKPNMRPSDARFLVLPALDGPPTDFL